MPFMFPGKINITPSCQKNGCSLAPVNISSPRDVALANQYISVWREAGASAFYVYLRVNLILIKLISKEKYVFSTKKVKTLTYNYII